MTIFAGCRSKVQYSHGTTNFGEYLSLLLKIIRQANDFTRNISIGQSISIFLQNKSYICFLQLKSCELAIYTELLVKLKLVKFLLLFS